MKKIITLLLLTSISTVFGQRYYWGVGALVGAADAEFQNSFVLTGNPGGISATNWTALSINDANGSPGAAYWTRNLIGRSQGAYSNTSPVITSPSQANGTAIFDSDFLDNGGAIGAFGTGSSPSPHRGELISPRMDFTGYTDTLMDFRFFSRYKNFNISLLAVSFSTDDGTSWTTPIDYRSYQAEETDGFIRLPIPDQFTAGVANLTQCRVKFIFDGDYYYAILDDISFMNRCAETTSSTTDTACVSYTSPSGKTFDTTGIYLDTITNTVGCDSIITINLTISDTTSSTMDVAVCYSYTSPSGKVWNMSNTYLDTIANTAGCDSIITINLTVNQTFASFSDTGCLDYTSPSGKVWDTTGIYTDTITNNLGCDSVLTIDVFISTYPPNDTARDTICNDGSYDLMGMPVILVDTISDSLFFSGNLPCPQNTTFLIYVKAKADFEIEQPLSPIYVGDSINHTISIGDNDDVIWYSAIGPLSSDSVYKLTYLDTGDFYIYAEGVIDGCTVYDTITITVLPDTNSSGIYEINKPFIKVYPNPTTDMLTVDMSELTSSKTIELSIYNAAGSLVEKIQRGGNNKLTISMDNYIRGNYYLLISSENFKKSIPFVVAE